MKANIIKNDETAETTEMPPRSPAHLQRAVYPKGWCSPWGSSSGSTLTLRTIPAATFGFYELRHNPPARPQKKHKKN